MPLDGQIENYLPEEVDEIGKVCCAAADLIERQGWWNGTHDGVTSLNNCLVTAIIEVTDCAVPLGTWQRLGFDGPGSTWKWNDAPERTAAEVIARLRAAAHG